MANPTDLELAEQPESTPSPDQAQQADGTAGAERIPPQEGSAPPEGRAEDAPAPKKRGRPRKAESAVSGEAAPKKRKRPAKAAPKATTSAPSADEEDTDDDLADDDIPKKRGRTAKGTEEKSVKDIDRDMMFQKIMPALANNPFTDLSNQDLEMEPIPASPSSPLEIELSALQSRLFARPDGLKGIRTDEECTINVMENLVLRHLNEVMLKFNCCRCDRCRRDVAALALNNLPPRYVVVDAHHINEIGGSVPRAELYEALIRAVLRVRMFPRH